MFIQVPFFPTRKADVVSCIFVFAFESPRINHVMISNENSIETKNKVGEVSHETFSHIGYLSATGHRFAAVHRHQGLLSIPTGNTLRCSVCPGGTMILGQFASCVDVECHKRVHFIRKGLNPKTVTEPSNSNKSTFG